MLLVVPYLTLAFVACAVSVYSSPVSPAPSSDSSTDASDPVSSSTASIASLSSCCSSLLLVLGSKVSYPGSAVYASSEASYFSGQESDLKPSCIVRPTSTTDVSTAIGILTGLDLLRSGSCKFAIRGQGHTPFSGAANIDHGVTIDLGSMNAVTVSADRAVTSVGSGAQWADVSRKLDLMGLAVAGGRISSVGVGGLTTGGGMSFFSPRKGWVCDNVVNYEVVLAGGWVVNANAIENPNLWLALRGGSNNLGVVTRFDYKSFEQGPMWGGFIFYPISTVQQQLDAFTNLNEASNYDEYASLITTIGYTSANGYDIAQIPVYTAPVVNPPAFQPFTQIQPQLFSTMRIANLTGLTDEQDTFNTNGIRETFITTTFKSNVAFLTQVFHLWNDTVPALSSVSGLVYNLVFQPLPSTLTSKSAQQGGNLFGLEGDGNLVLCLLSVTWNNAADDSTVLGTGRALFNAVDEAAKAKGLYNQYRYLNYAEKSQATDVINGFGVKNKAKLQAASRKYDPTGLFQRAVPGGFKIFV